MTDYTEHDTPTDNGSIHRNTASQQPTTSTKTSSQSSGEVVSISSNELPVTKPSKTVLIEKSPSMEQKKGQIVEVRSTVFPKDKDLFFQTNSSSISNPPSYAETIRSISSSVSDSSSQVTIASQPLPLSAGQHQPMYRRAEEFRLSDTDLLRSMSTSSRFSVDSLMVSPTSAPFERDAFGRLSMSERKGRAHLDATKSDFYSKMKKYKSMEDISFSKSKDIVYFFN